MSLKRFWNLLGLTVQAWQADQASRLAAALAYYTAFSLAPMLILVVAFTGVFVGEETVQGELLAQVQGLLGIQGAEVVEIMMRSASDHSDGLMATLVSLALLLFGASSVFIHLKEALNSIWNVEDQRQAKGIHRAVSRRLLSFAMIPIIGFLLLVSLSITTGLSYLGNIVTGDLRLWFPLIRLVNSILSFGMVMLLFAWIYKALPDARVKWTDVWVGAGATSGLFTVGKWAFGLYLGNSSFESTYGAAGSFVVLLVWLYYSAQILLFGAEFTQVYANHCGSKIRSLRNTTLGRDKILKNYFD